MREAAGGRETGCADETAGAGGVTTDDTFREMKAVFRAFAARDDAGSWTRYHSPSTACSLKVVPALTRARIGLFWFGPDRTFARGAVTLTVPAVCAKADPVARMTPSTVTREIESLFMALLSVRLLTDIDMNYRFRELESSKV